MKNKIKYVIGVLITSALMMTACSSVSANMYDTNSIYSGDEKGFTFTEIGYTKMGYVCKHEETGVYYVYKYQTGMCPIYNADGTLYTDEIKDNK